ncbi:hypothetical protein GFS31_40980 (plasmid) [Leptolyngbya sp. BL0902]|nr:hypothetical protein GFS31_40980 [Leptolyngbya sp. BL0902]
MSSLASRELSDYPVLDDEKQVSIQMSSLASREFTVVNVFIVPKIMFPFK